MKNNKILYILTLIITLFSFNTNVYAADEWTCYYEKENSSDAIILIQDSNANITMYFNNKDISMFGPNWIIQSSHSTYKDYELYFDISYNKQQYNYLSEGCPAYVGFEKSNQRINIYGTKASDDIQDFLKIGERESLNQTFNEIIKPGEVYQYYENTIKGLSCLYEQPSEYSYKVLLIQDEKGNIEIYLNPTNAQINEANWERSDYGVAFKKNESSRDDYGVLQACPKYAKVDKYKKIVELNNDKDTLEKEVNAVLRPSINSEKTMEYDENISIELGEDDGRCYYERTVENNKKHKIVVTFGFDDNGEKYVYWSEKDPYKSGGGSNFEGEILEDYGDGEKLVRASYKFGIERFVTAEEFFNQFYNMDQKKGSCPFIGVYRNTSDSCNTDVTDEICRDASNNFANENTKLPGLKKIHTTVYLYINNDEKLPDGQVYYKAVDAEGNDPIGGTPIQKPGIPNFEFKFDFVNVENCKDLVGEDGAKLFNIAWNIVKFGVPIALLALGTIDFAQAVFAGKEDGMKKAQDKFIKRLVIAVVIFLVPTLISFLLGIANSIWGNIGTDLCGIIF